jgi:hypothetical protein
MTADAGARNEALEAAISRQLAVTPPATANRVQERAEAYRAHQLAKERRDSAYHQVRILLLIDIMSGESGALDGLTKLAKLDFLLRYPVFLVNLLDAMGAEPLPQNLGPTDSEKDTVESRMIRYKYGPWDDRYYGVIGALIGRGLIEHSKGRGGNLAMKPTPGGHAMAQALASEPSWNLTAERCRLLKRNFGRYSGNRIKDLIYTLLPDVVDRPHRTEI